MLYRYHPREDSHLSQVMNYPNNASSAYLSYHKGLLTEGLPSVLCRINTVASYLLSCKSQVLIYVVLNLSNNYIPYICMYTYLTQVQVWTYILVRVHNREESV